MRQWIPKIGALGIFLIAPFTLAQASVLNCEQEGNAYQVRVRSDHQEAEVRKNGTPLRFGELFCGEESEDTGADLKLFLCRSKNVVDAGYYAVFVRDEQTISVQLSEVWFGGIRPLGTLDCREEE